MTVAWFSFFPIEWLPDLPPHLRTLPQLHPATWQRTLLVGLRQIPGLKLHVLVLRRHFKKDEILEHQGVTFHLLKTPPGLRALSLFWLDTARIRGVLDRVQPDVVHAWGTENGAALVASRLGRPSVVTVQGLMSWMEGIFQLTRYERFAAAMERHSMRRLGKGTLVTGESTFSAGYLRERYPGLTVRRVELAPDGVFHLLARRPQLNPRRLVFIGELGPRKGGDTLVLALEQLRARMGFELVVIGTARPEFLQEMKQLTSPELWTHIRFKHGLSSAQVAEELSEAALLICPTRADTGPMAVKEAVVAGVPVVASRVGGVVDYVFPGANGVLCDAGDVPGLAEAILEACRHPLFSQGHVDAATLMKMRGDLSSAQMGRSFFEAYQAVLGQNP